jgi:hypothetical protein
MELDQPLHHPLTDIAEIHAQAEEDLGTDTLTLPDETEQDVLGAYVAASELLYLAEGELQDLFRPGREGWRAPGQVTDRAGRLLGTLSDRDLPHAHVGEYLRGDAAVGADQPEEDVLRTDEVVVE